MRLIAELRRRNVFRMAVLYVVAAWLVMQVAGVLMDLGVLSAAVGPWVLVVLVIGFPIALVFSWLFEITPEGLALEEDVPEGASITHITGRRMDFIVIAVLSAGLILFAYDKWWIPAPAQQSIAVLPFVNMSDDPGNEYFSDGVSEEIINLLAQVPDLIVISRSSAFSFKGKDVDIRTIANRLNVAHVLEGSVRKSGNQLRVTAQLIEVETDAHLWSENYDRKLENVFAIQDEIAANVVDELKIRLLGDLPKSTETNPEAYALYLQGLHYAMQRYSVESFQQAETLLTQALEIDPGYAPAWAHLAYVYERQVNFALRPVDEGAELMRHAIQQALAIDPQYGLAYAMLARVEMWFDWDFAAASEHLQRALELNPRDFKILMTAGHLHRVLGRLDEAIDFYRQGIALDPVVYSNYFRLGSALYAADRLDEAADSMRKALSLNPDVVDIHTYIGLVLLAQGDAQAALLAMQQNTGRFELWGMAIVQHALGNDEASDAALQEFIECCAAQFAQYQAAQVYAFRGEIDHAFDWLQRAYDEGDAVVYMLSTPLLANLHDDPRWEPFLDKIGLPH